jgi:hypothetical protein
MKSHGDRSVNPKDSWKSVLKADPLEWLLEKENPGVRLPALTDILDRPADDPEVEESRRDIMKTGVIPKIMAKQSASGYWELPDRFYVAKYKGTVWQLIILAQLGADGRDERIRRACEFILAASQHSASGGFAYRKSAKTGEGLPSEVIPCLSGNLVWSLIRLGMWDDPRVKQGIDWIARYQRFDDGIPKAPKGWPYDRYDMCWGKHSCHMGAAKALKALAAIPEKQRTSEIKKTLDQGAEYFLKHHIHKKSHDLGTVSKPGWLRLGFPLMYQSDILEVLDILTGLGYRDPRMQEAVDALISRQDDQGRWKLGQTFNGRFQTNIERKGFPSKWLTVRALTVLKRYFAGVA